MTKTFDVVVRGGMVYDGSGREPLIADVGIVDDIIASIGENIGGRGNIEIDATGLSVAPGFINMLSWANESLIEDGRSQAGIRQGVTLEVMGEGSSMGPLSESMKKRQMELQRDIKYDVEWTTLREYLDFLVARGVSTNISSFVGASTLRIHVLGSNNVKPDEIQLNQMCDLAEQAMREGALGVTSALVYAPAIYAKTVELTALARVAARYNCMYASHLRSEGDALIEAVDELLQTARDSGARSEIYHLKAAGRSNWHKMDLVLDTIDSARADGLEITADMYLYEAGNTGLDVAMPPWVQEGGLSAWIERLENPEIRARVKNEMSNRSENWENGYLNAGGADGVLLVGFKNESLKHLTGLTLSEIAERRNTSPEEAAMDLVVEDRSRVETVYFWMCEENIVKQLEKPWMSIGSDGSSMATEGIFLKSNTHPRAYGNASRFLARYVREKKVMSLQEAVRRLTSLPAGNLRLRKRGLLKPDYFADVVVFDPARVQDRATYDNPHQYSEGMHHVFVNGQHVLKEGEHTGLTPGRVVLGPAS